MLNWHNDTVYVELIPCDTGNGLHVLVYNTVYTVAFMNTNDMTIMVIVDHGWHNHALSIVDINGNVYHRQNEMVMRKIPRVRANVMSTGFNVRFSHNRPKHDIIIP